MIPVTLSDDDGVAYAVLTPVEGGSFVGDGYSLEAGAGAVSNGEYIGVSMAPAGDASNVGMTWHRYTLAGQRYVISVVDADRVLVSDYALNKAVTACAPLPSELRGNIADIVLAAADDAGGTTVLSTSVKITPDAESRCAASCRRCRPRSRSARPDRRRRLSIRAEKTMLRKRIRCRTPADSRRRRRFGCSTCCWRVWSLRSPD